MLLVTHPLILILNCIDILTPLPPTKIASLWVRYFPRYRHLVSLLTLDLRRDPQTRRQDHGQ